MGPKREGATQRLLPAAGRPNNDRLAPGLLAHDLTQDAHLGLAVTYNQNENATHANPPVPPGCLAIKITDVLPQSPLTSRFRSTVQCPRYLSRVSGTVDRMQSTWKYPTPRASKKTPGPKFGPGAWSRDRGGGESVPRLQLRSSVAPHVERLRLPTTQMSFPLPPSKTVCNILGNLHAIQK